MWQCLKLDRTKILNSTGFVGRISRVIDLEELSLDESNQFLNHLGLKGAAYEKFKILSVTGGVPRYLEEIKPQLTAEEIERWQR